jgi:hypothetical protein
VSELRGPTVGAALAGVAESIVRHRPSRALWRFMIPGLNERLFRTAAIESGLLKESKEFGDLWSSPVSGADLERLRQSCLRLTRQPDPLSAPLSGPAVDRWRADLAERMRREGIDPLPELRRPIPAELQKRIDGALARLEG